MSDARNGGPPISLERASLAVLSIAAAGIHFAVMGEHFGEWVGFGVFFAVVAWLQALWAVGVVVAPTRPLLSAGAIGNGLVVLVWVITRTVGLPVGPDPGVPEAATFIDVLSSILELVIVAGAIVLAVQRRPEDAFRGRTAAIATAVLTVALGVISTAAIASAAGGEGGHQAHEEEVPSDTMGHPGFTRVDLGDGSTMQVLAERSGGATQVHVTFFAPDGRALDVTTLSMSATSASGEDEIVPVSLFEKGHYAANTELAPGTWTFNVDGRTRGGQDVSATFPMEIG